MIQHVALHIGVFTCIIHTCIHIHIYLAIQIWGFAYCYMYLLMTLHLSFSLLSLPLIICDKINCSFI